jgi:hypothetical protein
MDFNTSLEETDPEVVVRTPNVHEMKRGWTAAHEYNAIEFFEEAEQWLRSSNEKIKAGEQRLKLGSGQTVAQIRCRIL